MKLREFIALLQEVLEENGDLSVVGIANGTIYEYIDANVPDSDSPLYIELFN